MNVSVSATGVLLYDSSNTFSQPTWFDRAGRVLGTLGEPNAYSTLRISPDGRRIAAARDSTGGGRALWLLDVERGASSRLTSNPGVNWWAIWSPDGHALVFSGPSRNLVWMQSSEAGEERQLTHSPGIQNPNDWSRDGRLLMYSETTKGTYGLWVLPITPEGNISQPRLYLRSAFNVQYGHFSPEPSPRWVAYQSDETGRWEVYIQSFPEPHGKFQISTGGGEYPAWGPDGRELFYAHLVSPFPYDLKGAAIPVNVRETQMCHVSGPQS